MDIDKNIVKYTFVNRCPSKVPTVTLNGRRGPASSGRARGQAGKMCRGDLVAVVVQELQERV